MNGSHYRQIWSYSDHYELIGEIGRGGMGVVYRAYQPALDRTIALKVLSPDLAHQPGLVARLHREAISAARLRHPNIALLYEFGQADHTPFLAMEYVPGSSLRRLLEAGKLSPERVLAILQQIGDALDYAHGLGIVHRDVKPSNIVVCPGDHAVLIDFGLAEMAESSLLTADSVVLGTPHYMAPEQAAGRGTDARSDQYALAAVAYELLTGTPPFHGRSSTAVVHAHIYELPPPPTERCPALPVAVNAVLLRALSKTPQQRYPSLATFVAALRSALAAPPAPSLRPKRRRLLALTIGIGLMAVFLLTTLQRDVQGGSIQDQQAEGGARSGVPLPQQIVWSYDSNLVGGPAPVVVDATLVVGTLDGAVVALRAESGDVRWYISSVDGRKTIFGAPTAGDGLIFVGSTDEEVFGLSLDSGGVIWRRRVVGGVQLAPILDNERLIVTTTKGYIYVLQAGSGQVIWSRPLALGMQVPTVSASRIFATADRSLSALDIRSGTIDWEFETASMITTQPTVFGNVVLVGTERGVLHALSIVSGQEQWRSQMHGALKAAPAVASDVIFVVDQAGGVTALSADGRTVLWHFDTAAAITTTPLLADDKLFFGGSNGVFYALDARSGRQAARIELGGSVISPPVLGAGLIYVRADQIYALGY